MFFELETLGIQLFFQTKVTLVDCKRDQFSLIYPFLLSLKLNLYVMGHELAQLDWVGLYAFESRKHGLLIHDFWFAGAPI